MNTTDPQFLYMTLILPSLFGLTMVGEGVYKIKKEHTSGWVNILLGIGFMGIVIMAFFVLSSNV